MAVESATTILLTVFVAGGFELMSLMRWEPTDVERLKIGEAPRFWPSTSTRSHPGRQMTLRYPRADPPPPPDAFTATGVGG